MARKRGFFKRTAPDRGWYVGDFQFSVTASATPTTAATLNGTALFDFFDINADNTLITQEKSDWFIKRVLVDVFPSLSRNSATSLPARLWEFGLMTMDDSVFGDLITGIAPVISATVFDGARRTLRTYTKPVYATWEPRMTAAPGQRVDTAGAVTERMVADSPWGTAHVSDDFEVSNASLVETSSLYAMASTVLQGPGSYDWAASDVLNLAGNFRVLLQKRRT